MGIIQQLIGPVPQAAAWFGMQLALMIVGALVARPTTIGRAALLLPMLACMALPLVAPLPPLSRALLACLGMLAVLKLLQLGYEPRWAAHHPVWHGLSPSERAELEARAAYLRDSVGRPRRGGGRRR